MKLDKLRDPLTIDQIDFRVQSIGKKKIENVWGIYATILAYKDARVDMERLDNVVGTLNWTRRHTRENHNCIVSIFDSENNQWVSKEDTGTESNTEAEKGLASDSFKRACFNWGIGRELYDFPLIQIELAEHEVWQPEGAKQFRLDGAVNLREWNWYAEHDKNGKLSFLACQDTHEITRWSWGEMAETKKKRLKVEAKAKKRSKEEALHSKAWVEVKKAKKKEEAA